jgi:hypothetical protein
MKSMLTRVRWALACFVAPLIVALHRFGKPNGFEVFNGVSGTTFNPVPLLSHDDDPNWKVVRMPFTAGGGVTLANVPIGALIKFGAARADVLGALAADDAVLEGVVIDKGGTDPANTGDTTVAVALSGSFDKNTIKYADGTQPISAAGLKRLHEVQIYLDACVPGGGFAP